jgi:hypothetical protein
MDNRHTRETGAMEFLTSVYIVAGIIAVIIIVFIFLYKRAPTKPALGQRVFPQAIPLRVEMHTEVVTQFMRNNVYRLHINVRMSQRDYDIIQRHNLSSTVLAEYTRYERNEPWYPIPDKFRVEHLTNTACVDFLFLPELEEVQAQLTQNLPNLRTTLEKYERIENPGNVAPTIIEI